MKTNALIRNLIVILCVCVPFIYMGWIWGDLPERVPTHFGIDGKPDAFGTKKGALVPIFIVMGAGLFAYFLIKNIEKFDPKRANQASKDTFEKFAMLILIFMSGLSLYIVHSTVHSQIGGFLFVLLGLFFAAMGNLMHSIKPNYFVGIRLPWTLDNDDNWRKTHQLAGRIWFASGLTIAVLALLFSGETAFVILFSMLFIMILIPVVYSYRLYKKSL